MVTLPKNEKPKRGRPASANALSPAEKQQRYRERQNIKLGFLARDLYRAKETGDWSAVEHVADALVKF